MSPIESAPGPRGFGWLRALHGLRKNPLETFARAAEKYGPVVRFAMPDVSRTFYLCHEPEHVRQVLVERAARYSKETATFARLRDVIGRGILTAEGENWRTQRKRVQPCIHAARRSTLLDATAELTRERAERWREAARDRRPIDLRAEMARLTLSVLARSLFESDARASAAEVGRALDDVILEIQARIESGFPFREVLPLPGRRRYRRGVARLESEIDRVLGEQRRECPAHPANLVRAAESADGPGRPLRDLLVATYLAGHETTANALTAALWLLARHPGAADRVRREATEVLGDEAPTAERVARLEFTRSVVHETLRLHPPVWILERRSESEDRLAGYVVPPGTTISLCLYLTQRKPALWERPNDFVPERFLDRGVHGRSLAFGLGPRGCAGGDFALDEMTLVLGLLGREFRLDVPASVEWNAGVTLRVKGSLEARVVC